jgi:DNA-binding transcriptional LysR family regulator
MPVHQRHLAEIECYLSVFSHDQVWHLRSDASKTLFVLHWCPSGIDMELRHLRYFVAVGEEQHYGRAAARLHVAQPALSRQIQDLEEELGVALFERLPRGVKLSAAGVSFLDDARRILQEVKEATSRANRVARGQSGTLRVGFTESASWHGVVPDSFRLFRKAQSDAELQLFPSASPDQIEAVRSRRLDAGFVFGMPKSDPDLDQVTVAIHHLVLAVPKGDRLTRIRKLRLRDISNTPFIWFPRRQNPAYYDLLMQACFRGGLKTPQIIQEVGDPATMLSLVSCRLGVAFVSEDTRWRRPTGVSLMQVTDLDLPLTMSLIWRRDNTSPLLAKFAADVQRLPEVRVSVSGESRDA